MLFSRMKIDVRRAAKYFRINFMQIFQAIENNSDRYKRDAHA